MKISIQDTVINTKSFQFLESAGRNICNLDSMGKVRSCLTVQSLLILSPCQHKVWDQRQPQRHPGSPTSTQSLLTHLQTPSPILLSAEIEYLHGNLVFPGGITSMIVRTGEGKCIKLCTTVKNYIKKKNARQEQQSQLSKPPSQ